MWHVWRQERCICFSWGDLREDHLQDPGVDGMTILKWKEVGWGSRDWIDLAQDRDRWREMVNAVMNRRVP
jgi:hypothetical protein